MPVDVGRLRLLFVMPFPPSRAAHHGGGRVVAMLVAELAERHDVTVLALRAPDDARPDDEIARLAEVVEVPRRARGGTARQRARLVWSRARLLRGDPIWMSDLRSADFARTLAGLARRVDPHVVQFEYPVMAQYLGALAGVRAPLVLVEHDPPTRLAAEAGIASGRVGRLVQRLDARAWSRFERRALGAFDAAVTFTAGDAELLHALAPAARVVTIPFGTTLPDAPLSPAGEEPPRAVFVGSFTHVPNVDAARWLALEVFPPLRAARPALTLDLVGRSPPPEVRALAGDGVAIHGDVPDVTPYLDRAAVVLAPLRMGGGMRLKVVEALAAGKAVVASPRALAGLDVVPGRHVVVAETAEDVRSAVVRLVDDRAARVALGTAARAWASGAFRDGPAVAFERLYRTLVGERAGAPLGSVEPPEEPATGSGEDE